MPIVHGAPHGASGPVAPPRRDRRARATSRPLSPAQPAGSDDRLAAGRRWRARPLSQGRTRTAALWVEDGWKPAAPVTPTLGARYEWWRTYDGANFARAPAVSVTQPELHAARFSPKATLAVARGGWTIRASAGQAWRFPTAGELYQVVTTPVAAIPNPNLRPERARAADRALHAWAGRR